MSKATLTAAVAALALSLPTALHSALAHEHHRTFSAGEPGDPLKPARTINVAMREEYGRQTFTPARIEVKRGEQIRFVIRNEGEHDHEFLLATTNDNLKHAAAMRRHPHMAHHDANGITLAPSKSGEIVWKFTRRGTFEFSCLIPGHREDGMTGTVVVK